MRDRSRGARHRQCALALGLVLAGCTGPAPDAARVGPPASPPVPPEAVPTTAGARPAPPDRVERRFGRTHHAALEAWLAELGARLTRHVPLRGVTARFRIADTPVPNAFAFADGTVYVSRGLLALVNTEDELVNVLGHELAHVEADHHRARVLEGQSGGLGGVLGALLLHSPGEVAAYSRNQEHDADRRGQELARLAGADPAAMATFLRSLDASERLRTGVMRRQAYFDTHPPPTRRAAEASLRAGLSLGAPDPAELPTRAAYLARVDGLLVGDNPAQGLWRGNLFLHPELAFAIRFPDGWALHNAAEAITASAPRGDAAITLRLQGRGEDPEAAARVFLAVFGRTWTIFESEPLRLRGLAAWRVRAESHWEDRHTLVHAVWIAWQGHVYRIESASPSGGFPRFRQAFDAVVKSFRPLQPSQLAKVPVRRLRVVRARSGETLEALSARSGNAWSPRETAVVNALALDAPLPPDFPVKIAGDVPD